MNNLGILLSGRGSNFEAIANNIASGKIPNARIAVLISNLASAGGLEIAKRMGIAAVLIPSKGVAREEHDRAVVAALKEHKVDLIPGTRLTNGDPALRAYAHTLFTQKDAVGRAQMAELVARQGFIEKNRAAVVDYLEDSLRELRWFSDPSHHAAAVKIFSDFTKIPAAQFDPWLFVKGEDYYKDPKGTPDLDALQANVDTMRSLGFTKETLEVKKYADLSLVKEAAARLE